MGKEHAGRGQCATMYQAALSRTSSAQCEDEDQRKDVEGRVVGAFAALGPASRPLVILSSAKLVAEEIGRDVAPR